MRVTGKAKVRAEVGRDVLRTGDMTCLRKAGGIQASKSSILEPFKRVKTRLLTARSGENRRRGGDGEGEGSNAS